MSRYASAYAVLGVVAAVAAGATTRAREERPRGHGASAAIVPAAVVQSRANQTRLLTFLRRFGRDCFVSVPSLQATAISYAARLNADAEVECTANGEGVTSVGGRHFPTPESARRYVDERIRFYGLRQPFACYSSVGMTRWAGSDGRARGRVVCAQPGGNGAVVWTDDDRGDVYWVEGDSLPAVREWWHARVRRTPEAARLADERLADAVKPALSSCRRSAASAPAATASVQCDAPDLSNVYVEQFSSEALLDEHFDLVVDEHQYRWTPSDDDGALQCRSAGQHRGAWRPDGERRGAMACFTIAFSRAIVWTDERTRRFVYAVRDDGGMVATYDAWARLTRALEDG